MSGDPLKALRLLRQRKLSFVLLLMIYVGGVRYVPTTPCVAFVVVSPPITASSRGVQQHFQPTRARGNETAGVRGTPSFTEADADCVPIVGPLTGTRASARQMRGSLVIKDLDGVTGQDFVNWRGEAPHGPQSGGTDEEGVLASVVRPDPVGFLAEQQTASNFSLGSLDSLAAVSRGQLAQAQPVAVGQVGENADVIFVDRVQPPHPEAILPVSQFAPVAVFQGTAGEGRVYGRKGDTTVFFKIELCHWRL